MARTGKLVRSASSKEQFKNYPIHFAKNKLAKLERAAKEQPNNKVLLANLDKALDSGIKYTRNRKSRGHVCKGAYNSLGFIKNTPTDLMIRGHAPLHLYNAGSVLFEFNNNIPNHGRSIAEQMAELGFEIRNRNGKRKYKKTAR